MRNRAIPSQGKELTMRLRAVATGATASAVLLALYFLLVGLLSGLPYAVEQFTTYWYFLVSLAAGFGIQMGLYTYLKRLVVHPNASKKVVAVSGTTSTAAMVSCCAHYLTNILPILGATGLVTFAVQYQVQLFWVGLAFNLAGIAYILARVMQATREHARCAIPV
jgi:Cu+-exporting ATPase